MQNKGFVRVFSILLALVCTFYLSFSFVTGRYNKLAEEYANGDISKESFYLDSLANKKIWLGYSLRQCREMEVTLGLDLKGGMNVILELNVSDVLRSLASNNQDPNFVKALDMAYARQASGNREYLELFVEEYRKLSQGAPLAGIFSTIELKEKITSNTPDAQVISVIREEIKSAIDNSFNVLRTRIDQFGVVSPNIQRLETTGRILVELPGVKEPERVRKLLQGSANLEFWETYDATAVFNHLAKADTELARLLKPDAPADSTATATSPKETADLTADTQTEADSLLAQLGENADVNAPNSETSLEEYQKEHPLFAKLQPNVDQSGNVIPGPIIGYAQKNNMAAVMEYLDMPQIKALLPRDLIFKWAVKSYDPDGNFYQLYAIKRSNRDGTPALSGDVVTSAVADYSQQQIGRSEPQVSMTMNAEGAKAWARLTKENIGRCVAIVLDGMVYSAPNVIVEIPNGRSQITGRFTVDEAKDLANVLKSGKMAASVNIVQEDVVGPSLGQEAINAGVISFILALIILMCYMCAMYGIIPGLIVDCALLLNIFFTMGIMASLQSVLTLPGIAGIVLTMGMAVDANVLIYERTKEELRAGKGLAKALADGYKNAFSAIFDSNLTTIITGIVLFVFGTGPIRGFATTMIIGLVSSFLTAVFLTRLVYEALLAKNKLKNITFVTSFSKGFLANPQIAFLKMRKVGYLIPLAIIVLGAVSLKVVGLNNGIDFTGGRNYVVRFSQDVRTDEIRSALADRFEGSVSVITIGTQNQIRVSTNYRIDDNDPSVDQDIESKLYEGLKSFLPAGTTQEQFSDINIQSSQKVGPSMAEDIKNSALWAVIFAMFCMAFYILLRFRDVAFSVGVFISVFATTLCIISSYTLLWKILPFSMEVDQTFVAAILTVIGYSINDTVVVFDRIRETIFNYPKRDRYQVINDALNSTLARTFNTSFSTFVVVLCIFLLGGATIRSFTFAILLGVIIGTYSTLFVATPIAYEIQRRKINKTATAAGSLKTAHA